MESKDKEKTHADTQRTWKLHTERCLPKPVTTAPQFAAKLRFSAKLFQTINRTWMIHSPPPLTLGCIHRPPTVWWIRSGLLGNPWTWTLHHSKIINPKETQETTSLMIIIVPHHDPFSCFTDTHDISNHSNLWFRTKNITSNSTDTASWLPVRLWTTRLQPKYRSSRLLNTQTALRTLD